MPKNRSSKKKFSLKEKFAREKCSSGKKILGKKNWKKKEKIGEKLFVQKTSSIKKRRRKKVFEK